MSNERIVASWIFLLLNMCIISADAQIKERDVMPQTDSIYASFRSLYHFRFEQAAKSLQHMSAKYPDNPLTHMSAANFDWWLLISGIDDDSVRIDLEKHSSRVIDKYGKRRDLTNEELYCLLSVYAINARVAVLQEHYLGSVAYLNQSIRYLKQSFGREASFPWFYITSGMYNYYVEREKITFPLLYPYLIMLPKGDMEKGMEQVRHAAGSSDEVLSTEATYFYFKILWEEEKDYKLAFQQLDKLISLYPDNLLYLYYRFKLLLEQNELSKGKSALNELLKKAAENPELREEQIAHFKELAKKELEKFYLRNGIEE